MNKIINLTEKRRDKEWQRIEPLLAAVEAELFAREMAPDRVAAAEAEADVIDTQLYAIDCCTRAKGLLLRALNNPEKGGLTEREKRLKRFLELEAQIK